MEPHQGKPSLWSPTKGILLCGAYQGNPSLCVPTKGILLCGNPPSASFFVCSHQSNPSLWSPIKRNLICVLPPAVKHAGKHTKQKNGVWSLRFTHFSNSAQTVEAKRTFLIFALSQLGTPQSPVLARAGPPWSLLMPVGARPGSPVRGCGKAPLTSGSPSDRRPVRAPVWSPPARSPERRRGLCRAALLTWPPRPLLPVRGRARICLPVRVSTACALFAPVSGARGPGWATALASPRETRLGLLSLPTAGGPRPSGPRLSGGYIVATKQVFFVF